MTVQGPDEVWQHAARRGAFLVYRGRHLRTLVVPERGYTLAVRLGQDVALEDFDPADIAATSGELPGPPWVALHPAAVERTYVTSGTALWGEHWEVWLAGPPDLETRTVLVGSHDPIDESLLRGRPTAGQSGDGWFTRAPLDELWAVTLTEEPYQLP